MLSLRGLPPVLDAASITVLRFLLMLAVVGGASLAGISSWFVGFAANVAVTILAVVLVQRRKLWHCTGLLTLWRSRWAGLATVPLLVEAISWTAYGIDVPEPGLWLWSLTFLLTGINEELISRGVILTRLAGAYRPLSAVTLTAAMFGLQHLSALALTGRSLGDVLGNVVLSGCYGFALAAFQLRFRWLWPLILIHAFADWTTSFAARLHPTSVIVAIHLGFLAYGAWQIRETTEPRVIAPPSTAVDPG